MTKINAIIMASGFSKRMKEDKLYLNINQNYMIDNIIDIIKKSKVDDFVVIVREENLKKTKYLKNKEINFIINKSANNGQSSSIKLGIKHFKDKCNFMFIPCDQPNLNIDFINKLVLESKKNKNSFIVPRFKNSNYTPTIFPYKYKEELLKLNKDVGGRNILLKNKLCIKYIDLKSNYLVKDIDTKDDYKKWLMGEIFMKDKIAVIRGGGDIASGTIKKLYNVGFKVLVLEIQNPTSIRRTVSFSEALYDNNFCLEGCKAVATKTVDEIKSAWDNKLIPVYIDEKAEIINEIKPDILIDAILAKKNLGTNKAMAPITIALGPGFEAKKDVDIVIETKRGHDLGRLIFEGFAKENTKIPGEIKGYSKERVIHSNESGIINNIKSIGDIVKKGEKIAKINNEYVLATIDGVLRGIIRDKTKVFKGMKIADIDPRKEEVNNCYKISDKARNIAGGVLEAILILNNRGF